MKESIKEIGQLLAQEPSHHGGFLFWADALFQQKDYINSINKCKLILKDDPVNIRALDLFINSLYYSKRLGQSTQLLDYNQLVKTYDLSSIIPSIQRFNTELNETICSKNDWIENPIKYSTTIGNQLLSLLSYQDECIQHLGQYLIQQALKYHQSINPGDFPYFKADSAELTINIWAVNLHTDGYQSAHIHPDGWISGVYYTQLPTLNRAENEGALQFGVKDHKGKFDPLHMHDSARRGYIGAISFILST